MNGLILFEDEDLLVVNKPSGINTHKPDRYAPDGIHEWLTKHEPRWRNLSILHRLDKDTSGAMVFGKTARANQSLAKQFELHAVEKLYLLLSAARPTRVKFRAKTADAATDFEFLEQAGDYFLVQARPLTGKTHQIRRHAANNGFPVLGDTAYEGEPAPRLMLHAHKIRFRHPATGVPVTFEASVPRAFDEIDPLVAATEFRERLFGEETNAFRLISGVADAFPEANVDSYDGTLLAQWQTETAAEQGSELIEWLQRACAPRAIYEQLVTKQKRTKPRLMSEGRAPSRLLEQTERPRRSVVLEDRLRILENGLTFLVNFGEGLATGIFLDQRENRRRLLTMPLAGKTVLNTFAYTCAFSVAAARAGAVTTSVDLSKKYLEWGKDNFRANHLNPAAHDFIFGDVFSWLRRFAKRRQCWDVVIVDPPTFSTTKRGRAFQAARDYEDLATLAMPLVAAGGWLLCSTNQRTLAAREFEQCLQQAAHRCQRIIEALEFETQPFDFRPATKEEPYLKSFWAKLGPNWYAGRAA
ncbi:MAG TPA: pseudouridine synthase [Verrucomicrobiae bacterium]|nr:pseudouridine synthase [Verrucomicrobiae bacterium]